MSGQTLDPPPLEPVERDHYQWLLTHLVSACRIVARSKDYTPAQRTERLVQLLDAIDENIEEVLAR